MSITEQAIAWSVIVGLLLTLIGLIARRRYSDCWSFVGYLAIVTTCEFLICCWPARFWAPTFWLIKQGAYDVAKILVAIELAWRVARDFPGALQTAKVASLFILAIATGLIATMPWSPRYDSMAEWHPPVLLSITALFALTAILVLWYRLPIRHWQRTLIMSFSGYLLAFTGFYNILRLKGWQAIDWFSHADIITYLAVVLWWALASWRREPRLMTVPRAAAQLELQTNLH
jgi:hypothetical protein